MAQAAASVSPSDGAARPWIGGRAFDLAWFFGGALCAVLAFATAVIFRPSIVVIAWIWILAFDGPHMMAGYTRTFLDREAMRSRRGLLLGSLGAMLVGPMFLAVSVIAETEAPFLAFLGFAATWGYYHVVRQHYGFVALYRARSGEMVTRAAFLVDKGVLYLGLWIPWLHFAVAHPVGRALRGAGETAPSALEALAGNVLVGAWGMLVVAYAVFAASRRRGSGLTAPYLLLVLAVHGAIYFVAARYEPIYAMAVGPDQKLLLMSVMGGVFHSAQYVGIVWLHNARTYRGPSASAVHGLAARASASLGRYVLVCLAFSALYLVIAAGTSLYPALRIGADAKLGPFRVSQLAICLWWGIALQHYVADQYIWRIKKDAALRKALAGSGGV